MIRLGLQIPNFTFPGVAPDDLFERVAAIATTGEQSGFDTVMVMDHFYQLPLLGPTDNEMFDSYTLLGALAARTESARLGTLVTGVTYRNPALLAKSVTALDVISRGRAFLGIGAAWFDVEHEALGVDFPPVAERFERLEEALHICRAMFRGERPTFTGRHYTTKDAVNSPAPLQQGGPPVMIGGQGERKTLRMMAEHADMANIITGTDQLAHKFEVLAGHCADVGRDLATINKTTLVSLFYGETMESAEAKRNAFLAGRGMNWDALDDAGRAAISSRMFVGDADSVGEQVRDVLDIGYDGVCVNLPYDAHDLENLAAAGQALTKAVA